MTQEVPAKSRHIDPSSRSATGGQSPAADDDDDRARCGEQFRVVVDVVEGGMRGDARERDRKRERDAGPDESGETRRLRRARIEAHDSDDASRDVEEANAPSEWLYVVRIAYGARGRTSWEDGPLSRSRFKGAPKCARCARRGHDARECPMTTGGEMSAQGDDDAVVGDGSTFWYVGKSTDPALREKQHRGLIIKLEKVPLGLDVAAFWRRMTRIGEGESAVATQYPKFHDVRVKVWFESESDAREARDRAVEIMGPAVTVEQQSSHVILNNVPAVRFEELGRAFGSTRRVSARCSIEYERESDARRAFGQYEEQRAHASEVEARIVAEHSGSSWTKYHRSVDGANLQMVFVHPLEYNTQETELTEELMLRLSTEEQFTGVECVRGGVHCQIRLTPDRRKNLEERFREEFNLCHGCGQRGHQIGDRRCNRSLRRERNGDELVICYRAHPGIDLTEEDELEYIGDDDEANTDGTLCETLQNMWQHIGCDVEHAVVLRSDTNPGNTVPLEHELISHHRDCVEAYGPDFTELRSHQFEVLRRDNMDKYQHVMLTSSTGSGKSASFWTWLIYRIRQTKCGTALALFPTQALLWGQADSLSRMSRNTQGAVHHPGEGDHGEAIPYAGTIKLWNREFRWTVWHGKGIGSTRDKNMSEHEKSSAFKHADIVLCTPDKVHVSLHDPKTREFGNRIAENLCCVVVDEAHMYGGIMGANMHFLLQRLSIMPLVAGNRRPRLFLASATLGDAKAFASSLIGDDVENIQHVTDGDDAKQPTLIDGPGDLLQQCITEIENAADSDRARCRLVLLLKTRKLHIDEQLAILSADVLGSTRRALLFSQTKNTSLHLSRRLKKDYVGTGRRPLIYDGDVPPTRRRERELILNRTNCNDGLSVLGTSALEIGVDISGMEFCLISKMPPDRMSLLQQIGRVGRQPGKPGLVVVAADPFDAAGSYALEQPGDFFNAPARTVKSTIKSKAIRLSHVSKSVEAFRNWDRVDAWSEWVSKMQARSLISKDDISLENGTSVEDFANEIEHKLRELLPNASGTSKSGLSGFRPGSTLGKIPVVECRFSADRRLTERWNCRPDGSTRRRDIKWLDSNSIFRSAHPEGLTIDERGTIWKVMGYALKDPPCLRRDQKDKLGCMRSYHLHMIRKDDYERNPEALCQQCLQAHTDGPPDTPMKVKDCCWRHLHRHAPESNPDNPCHECRCDSCTRGNPCSTCKLINESGTIRDCPVSTRDITAGYEKGQWLSLITKIKVVKSEAQWVYTEGKEKTTYQLEKPLPVPFRFKDDLTFGVFSIKKEWLGFYEKKKEDGEVIQFIERRTISNGRTSVDEIWETPFFEPATFHTYGFQWLARIESSSVLTNLEHVRRFAAYIIHHRLAQVLECQFGDIDVSIEAGPEDGTVNVIVVETAIGGTGLCFEVIALEKRAMFDKASSIWFGPRGQSNIMHGFVGLNDFRRRVEEQTTREESQMLYDLTKAPPTDTEKYLEALERAWNIFVE